MSDQLDLHGVFINSIVGEGAFFSGDISLGGLFRVDGDFTGTIEKADKVLVGKNGRAKCLVNAGTVVIGGVVKGDIRATEKVVVLSTGMVLGNIKTPRLLVEEGVILNGKCSIAAFSTEEKQNAAPDAGDEDKGDEREKIERYNPLSAVK